MADGEPKFELVSRKEAIASGAKYYFTGKPCRRGHVSLRYAVAGCVLCTKINSQRWRVEKADRRKFMDIKWRADNKARIAAKYRRHKAAFPLLSKQQWAERDVEKEKVRTRKYREDNREYLSEYMKKWRAENKEKKMASNRNYKARRRANGGTHSAEDVLDIIKSQKRKCAYCRTKLGKIYHVDHIIALVNGGSNARSNLQILCEPCNLRKGAMHPADYARTLGLLL